MALPEPSQLFSFIPTANDPPVVPIPAPAEISPVARSSTAISIFLRSSFVPSETSNLTLLKMFLALILEIDLSKFNLE